MQIAAGKRNLFALRLIHAFIYAFIGNTLDLALGLILKLAQLWHTLTYAKKQIMKNLLELKKITLPFAIVLLSLTGCTSSEDCPYDLEWDWYYTPGRDFIIIEAMIENSGGNILTRMLLSWEIAFTDNTDSSVSFGGGSFTIDLPPGKSYSFDKSAHIGDKTVSSIKLKREDIECM